MPKTHRSRSSKKHTMRRHSDCCEVTFHGLIQWYDMEFEKLGWMVLAKQRGHTDKIVSYLHSLERLKQALEHKLTHLKEVDRKNDVEIMLYNLDILIDHANKDLK